MTVCLSPMSIIKSLAVGQLENVETHLKKLANRSMVFQEAINEMQNLLNENDKKIVQAVMERNRLEIVIRNS
jgi:hypothetical protein